MLQLIAAADLVSRANYVYAACAAGGFLSSCFLLHSLVQTSRAQRRLAWLHALLWTFCGVQLLLLLLSLHAAARHLRTSAVGCAALSFAVNAASLCGLLLLVLMAYVLTLDPPSHAPLRRPAVCGALVALGSAVVSLVLAGVRGPSGGLRDEVDCSVDPLDAGVAYAAAKLSLAFLVPCALVVALLVRGCVRQRKSNGRFLSGSEEGPVFLAVTAVTLCCQFVHGVALVRGARLHREGPLSDGERALVSVAELLLYSGSGVSLLLVLLVHRPCRESVHGGLRRLRDFCSSPGRTQPHRNIIAPQIEITDTLQDIEA